MTAADCSVRRDFTFTHLPHDFQLFLLTSLQEVSNFAQPLPGQQGDAARQRCLWKWPPSAASCKPQVETRTGKKTFCTSYRGILIVLFTKTRD